MIEPIRIVKVRRLVCSLEQHRWDWAEQNTAEIDARWTAEIAKRPKLFDGPVLLAHRWSIGDGEFRCTFFETRYRKFMAAQRMDFPDTSVFNVFAMAALRSRDGAFLLGEMAAHTANAGQIYFPAGTPDRDDVKGATVDLAGSVLRELEEETGVAPHEVALLEECTVVISGQQIGCMQIVDLPWSATVATARIEAFLAKDAQPELARMHVVRSAADIVPEHMPAHDVAFLKAMLPN